MSNRMKALALISGGLDSVLAAKIISGQKIEVVGISFLIPFCGNTFEKDIKSLSEEIGIEIKLVDISEEFIEMLKTPKYGYGKNLNPCIDCRILELKKAHKLMKKLKANFIITGEVLGQRPMSQNKRAMETIEKESGIEGLIVRPLSAKLLPTTIPEKRGWIKTEKLLDISGRSRKRQYKLAEEFGISGYGSPAGGCLLTDPTFSLIVKNLISSDMLVPHAVALIKAGRYFSIDEKFKLVVGRNHEQNLKLMSIAEDEDVVFEPEGKGPVAIGWGKRENRHLKIASQIIAYYCKKDKINVKIKIPPGHNTRTIESEKISEQGLLSYRI